METSDLIIDKQGRLILSFMTNVSGSEIVGVINWSEKAFKRDGDAIKRMTFLTLKDIMA